MQLQIGIYKVILNFIQKKFFLPIIEKDENGEDKKKSIPMKKIRKDVILIHPSGTSVTFSSYIHKGQRFKDSRIKMSFTNDKKIVSELVRMLNISENEARFMLKLA